MNSNNSVTVRDINSDEPIERGKWANKTEFLLSCMGYAIGLGNIWRFPYLCYNNGGGAFLIPYLLMLVVFGIPLYYMEVALGQFGSVGCLAMFNMAPILKGAGYAMIFVNTVVMLYFNVIVAYPVLYLVRSFSFPDLPWASCNNSWNTPNCYELSENVSRELFAARSDASVQPKSSADEYFNKMILERSTDINDVGEIVWPLFFCNLFCWIIMYLCIQKGVKSIGKVVYFTVLFPFALLVILFVRGVTLPGAWVGIKFYLVPEWHKLLNVKVWVDAAMQIFFSLGPGWGGIVNVASFNKFKDNTRVDSIIVPIANCGTSIFAGFVVFSVLGFMSHKTGVSVADVATSGLSLAFVTYPSAISFLPWPQLWAVLFFFMLFLLGVDSSFVTIEAVTNALFDEYPNTRRNQKFYYLLVVAAMFIGSLPFVTKGGLYLLQVFDWYAASIAVIFICLVEMVMVRWIYGIENFVRDVEFMIGAPVGRYFLVCWKYLTPFLLITIFVMTAGFAQISSNEFVFPDWVKHFGTVLALTPIAIIPAYVGYQLWRTEGSLKEAFKTGLSSHKWGPAEENDAKRWLQICKK